MPKVRFALAASHSGRTVDLWKLVRHPDCFLTWNCEFPSFHHTYRDGEHPHSTAQDGLESAPVHPSIVAARQGHGAREEGETPTNDCREGWKGRGSDTSGPTALRVLVMGTPP
jgi:hypothetical protein